MRLKVIDILQGLNRIAPFRLAEEWDNVGLLIGDPDREVHSLFIGLDPNLSLLEEAVACGADTLITHHPCIFHPLSSVDVATPIGAFLEQALAHKINVIACHTNFDSAAEGVSDALAALLQLEELSPLCPVDSLSVGGQGLGRLGRYPSPIPFTIFMEKVFSALKSITVQVAGTPPKQIQTVALCGGSGSDFAEDAFKSGADIYLSSEIKHSTARWAEDAGFCVIDGTHFATEYPAVALLTDQLKAHAREAGWVVQIQQSKQEKPAFTFIHKDNF